MTRLDFKTAVLINKELEHIPLEYQTPYNSLHEGYGVLAEEFEELKDEIFYGKKKAIAEYNDTDIGTQHWKLRVKNEAIQVAAVAIRIIQELT